MLTLDIRTGCIAIYEGEKRNCLSGVSEDAIYYVSGAGEESEPNGYRYATDSQIADAKRLYEKLNILTAKNMETNIDALAIAWTKAKADESAAIERRIAIEEQIDALVGHRPEGNTTQETAAFKVTTTGTVYRKLDTTVWEKIKDKLPPEHWPVKIKLDVDTAILRHLQQELPHLYAIAAEAITSKPGKTAIKIVAKED